MQIEWIYVAFAAIGFIVHLLLKLQEAYSDSPHIVLKLFLRTYFIVKKNLFKVVVNFIVIMTLVAVWSAVGQEELQSVGLSLTMLTSFISGWAADSAIRHFTRIVQNTFQE